jgi:signal transduction histidine kinase
VHGNPVTQSQSARAPVAESLLSVLVELSFARELGQLMETARRSVRRLTGADGVAFVLRQGDECLYADEESIAPLWKGRRFPLTQCISGWVMLNGETAVVPDIYADARVPTEAYRPTFVRSLLMVPVRTDEPVAAIGVYWAARHEATGEEQDLVQAVANGAALALENVNLVHDLEEAANRERQARLAAERANRLTDQFLATVSHELRTPLNVIQGWLWQLRQPGMTPELTRHALAVVERNAAKQTQLVEDLLDASRAMSGAIRLERALVDVRETCGRVVEEERPNAESKGLSLDLRTGIDALLVFADADRLRQILRNLIDNAIKFTPSGGTIVVSPRRTGTTVQVSVADDGIGLQDEAVRRVFDRFWQQDGSATRTAGGLGLGLTLVRELVRLHGGLVTAESPGTGAGTTVTVELPAAGALAEALPTLLPATDATETGGRLAGHGEA